MIVDWRCQNNHFRLIEYRLYFLHVVVLYTLAKSLCMTVFTRKTSLYIHFANVEDSNLMSCTFSALSEGTDHCFRISGRSWASVQYYNVHFRFSSKKLFSFANEIFSCYSTYSNALLLNRNFPTNVPGSQLCRHSLSADRSLV